MTGTLPTVTFPDGKQSKKDFDGPLALIPRDFQEWVSNILPQVIDRSRMERSKSVDLPFEMIREGVVNALVHRDYEISGAKCQISIDADKIVILSPGAPLPPITLEQMQEFKAQMLSRNPALHYLFQRMDLAEERGIGLRSIKEQAEKLGLPLPRFEYREPYLRLTIYRSRQAASRVIPKTLRETLSSDEIKGWEWISTRESFTSKEYEEAVEISNRTGLRHLKQFIEMGLLRKTGRGPSTRYEVT
ncbi:ATP-binding protein [Roseibacillus ishigakijimensis]|uniref:ATP-dependent DNA helicase RecG C-terminal domain-containing protein n=1 Tax=Roseibacillus ishigakijimensis TaxID=454146 RepID=A0A934VMM6_9BACT|nr:ATP-binding protein [Roseibacillus ishigakijimensis]MBK1834437.1 hypothetical protein [Roseibacillus ishigakijimensis]